MLYWTITIKLQLTGYMFCLRSFVLCRWVRVKWDTGATNSYRMGREGQYDLKLADSGNSHHHNVATPNDSNNNNEKEDLSKCDLSSGATSADHPTKLLKASCIKFMQILSVSVGLHADKMQHSAVFNLVAMFRNIISNRIHFTNLGLDKATLLGFLRAIATGPRFCLMLTSDAWIELYLDMLENNDQNSDDIPGKIQCLRLLQSTLQMWTAAESERMVRFVGRIMSILSHLCIYCPNDYSLLQNPHDSKSRVLITASHTSTIADEIIVLMKRLYGGPSPTWRTVITEYVSQKLCIAADLFAQETAAATGGEQQQQQQNTMHEEEAVEIVSSLHLIGGYDARPRIGASVFVDGDRGTISGFTRRGNAIVHFQVWFYLEWMDGLRTTRFRTSLLNNLNF